MHRSGFKALLHFCFQAQIVREQRLIDADEQVPLFVEVCAMKVMWPTAAMSSLLSVSTPPRTLLRFGRPLHGMVHQSRRRS
jgi:hypothetical protein